MNRPLGELSENHVHREDKGRAKTKKGMGKEIYDPGREKKVLEKLKLRNRGPFKEQDLIKIFRTIMKVCRQSQA